MIVLCLYMYICSLNERSQKLGDANNIMNYDFWEFFGILFELMSIVLKPRTYFICQVLYCTI